MDLRNRTTNASAAYLRRHRVRVPTALLGTAAVFLVLRRMRAPLISLIGIVAVSITALALAPGTDASGAPHRLSIFEAFYVITYTMTTIGFGEIPSAFSIEQRIVVTVAIYLSVAGWAYSLGTLLTLLQDAGFKRALATQNFRRGVVGIREPFYILAGYGYAGRAVARELDDRGKRMVVVDNNQASLDKLAMDQLHNDAPGLLGDAHLPSVMGLAGLDRRQCVGVLALTDDESVNLDVVMSATLLRPRVPVLAFCKSPEVADSMEAFKAADIVNPYDAAGQYLLVALTRPSAYKLAILLLNPVGTAMPELPEGMGAGRWIVYGEGRFAREVASDLKAAGMDVRRVDPKDGTPDVAGVEGLVLAAGSDTLNLALGAKTRRDHPGVFLAMRQHGPGAAALVEAFAPDMVFDPKDLLVREVLARLVTPAYWEFVAHALHQSEEWAAGLLSRVVDACGSQTPGVERIEIDDDAPAVARRIPIQSIRLGDILRDPSERDRMLAIVPLVLVRDGVSTFVPDLDTTLRLGDELVVVGKPSALSDQIEVLYDDSTLQYAITGKDVPTTLVWRVLTGQPMFGERGTWSPPKQQRRRRRPARR